MINVEVEFGEFRVRHEIMRVFALDGAGGQRTHRTHRGMGLVLGKDFEERALDPLAQAGDARHPPVGGIFGEVFGEVDDHARHDQDRPFLHHLAWTREGEKGILEMVIDAAIDDDEEILHAELGEVQDVDIAEVLGFRTAEPVSEVEGRVLIQRALAKVVGRVDFGRAAVFGHERPEAVPATDVEDLLAFEVDIVQGADDQGIRGSPGTGSDAAVHFDGMRPLH